MIVNKVFQLVKPFLANLLSTTLVPILIDIYVLNEPKFCYKYWCRARHSFYLFCNFSYDTYIILPRDVLLLGILSS